MSRPLIRAWSFVEYFHLKTRFTHNFWKLLIVNRNICLFPFRYKIIALISSGFTFDCEIFIKCQVNLNARINCNIPVTVEPVIIVVWKIRWIYCLKIQIFCLLQIFISKKIFSGYFEINGLQSETFLIIKMCLREHFRKTYLSIELYISAALLTFCCWNQEGKYKNHVINSSSSKDMLFWY